MAAVHRGGGANAGQLGESDGLAHVIQIPVFRNDGFTLEKCLENDHGLALQPGGVKGERDVDGALAARGYKGGFSGNRLFARHDGFAGGLEHQLAPEGVFLAHGQAGILHRVGDGDLLGRLDGLCSVHGGGSPNLRLPERNRLPLVLQVGVRGH